LQASALTFCVRARPSISRPAGSLRRLYLSRGRGSRGLPGTWGLSPHLRRRRYARSILKTSLEDAPSTERITAARLRANRRQGKFLASESTEKFGRAWKPPCEAQSMHND